MVVRKIPGLAVFSGLCLVAGCVSTSKNALPEQPPTAAVYQVQALWQGRVITTADVVHKGAALPGVAGRVYLLGQNLATGVKAEGKLLVDLYATDPAKGNGQPQLLEHYEFPNEVLQRLLRKDSIIGWGYTVFLPWPEYRPDIKRVQLRVCFTPEGATPMFAPLAQISLRNDSGPVLVERVLPVAGQEASQQGAQIPMRVSLPGAAENK